MECTNASIQITFSFSQPRKVHKLPTDVEKKFGTGLFFEALAFCNLETRLFRCLHHCNGRFPLLRKLCVGQGPEALGKLFVYFAKTLVIISVIQVRPMIFFPPNFVRHYQPSKALSSCFGAVQIFFRCENCADFTICSA